ncbi:hypothetical protein J23TS9_28070 [Paenibacillus sp. J23TS9]|uniref:M56 family metallopeptidase n=1 Tax=Paenibacillus sp. J23TS9 TaxID=2807193 RepID=UPI001B05A9D4|nr:M56 family metallopeptidase [Paenibacillus sp. J23TS9]GIP27677.1 hypothetical protein J23TS9_28070 [Paenibacillus sp. J23TS9]
MQMLSDPSLNIFFDWVIKTTLLASIMTGLILVIKAVLKNRLKPGWHYALWLLLMLRLLIPAGPQTAFSIYNLFSWTETASENAAVPLLNTAGSDTAASSKHTELSSIDSENSGTLTVYPDQSKGSAWSIKQVLIGIWMVVAVLLLIRLLAVNIRFSMKLRTYAVAAKRADVILLAQARRRMGVKRRVRLSFSSAVSTPTLFGWIRPHLIMPTSSRELDVDRQNHIYLHELAHMKHADILVNWLMHLLLVLHWFNPLLWYALYKMREDQELSADALALRKIHPSQVSEYGYTIITLLERTKLRAYVPGAAGLSGSKQQLKRRILMIKNFKRKSIGWTMVGLALVVALSGCALTNGKTASDGNSSTPAAGETTPAESVTPDTAGPNNAGDKSGDTVSNDDTKNGSETGVNNTASTDSNTKSQPSDRNKGGSSSGSSAQASVNVTETKGHEQQIKDIAALAKKGKVKGADFVAGKTIIDDIHASWGEPDRPWQPSDSYAYDSYSPGAGRGTYAFGIGRGEVVYDIRYFGSPMDENQAFNQISFAEIKKTLGKPSSIKTNNTDDILTYKLGEYELKFVGPHKTQRLDHISVYSPKAAAPMGGSVK